MLPRTIVAVECLKVPVEFQLDLRATLSYLHGYFRSDGWWAPMRTREGPATLHIRRNREAVEARAFGPGSSFALATVRPLLGAGDAPESFAPTHPLIADLHRRHPGRRFGATGRVFDALVVAIVTQKVTGKEARRSLRLLSTHFSGPAPGPQPALGLPPDPDLLAQAAYYDLHPLGIEKRRADVLINVARRASEIAALGNLPPHHARHELESLPGIGPWTSAETTSVSHGDADTVSVGDFHLKNVVAWHLAGRPRGSDEEMMSLLDDFRPHRGRVVRLLETLESAPAFGPRVSLRNFAHY